jgi:hypothetical protein
MAVKKTPAPEPESPTTDTPCPACGTSLRQLLDYRAVDAKIADRVAQTLPVSTGDRTERTRLAEFKMKREACREGHDMSARAE